MTAKAAISQVDAEELHERLAELIRWARDRAGLTGGGAPTIEIWPIIRT